MRHNDFPKAGYNVIRVEFPARFYRTPRIGCALHKHSEAALGPAQAEEMPTLATTSTIVAEASQLPAPCVWHTRTGCREQDVKVFGYPQLVTAIFRLGGAKPLCSQKSTNCGSLLYEHPLASPTAAL